MSRCNKMNRYFYCERCHNEVKALLWFSVTCYIILLKLFNRAILIYCHTRYI